MKLRVFPTRACIAAMIFGSQTWALACETCRPLVQNGIHNADFSLNLCEVLLPILVIFSIAAGLFFADFWLSNRARRPAP